MYVWVLVLAVFVTAEISAFQRAENDRHGKIRVRHDVHNNSTPRRPCSIEQLEYKLSRLESTTAEKSDSVTTELRETNRRLQALEWKTSDVQTAVEEFKGEIGKMSTNQGGEFSKNLDLKIDDLSKGLQVVVAAVKILQRDISSLKKNESVIDIFTRGDFADSPDDGSSRRSRRLPENCRQVQQRGNSGSGIYRIQPELAPRAFMVLCDMESSGGGWTYIHNRHEGVQDFYLNWQSYKLGFGNLGGEFWLGLEYLHHLTGSEVNELLVEMEDIEGKRKFAHYGAFSVGGEDEGYPLKVLAGYKGDAGDSLIYHAGGRFSTKDKDQDEWEEGNCAQAHAGAWWYKSCDNSNLNGKYLKGEVPEQFQYQGMYWGQFRGPQYSLLQARMMIRPRGANVPLLLNQNKLNVDVPPN